MMDRLYRLFDLMARIPHDKCLHAIWGHLLALGIFLALGRGAFAMGASCLITTGVGLWKERQDKKQQGHESSTMDLLATMAGGATVWLQAALQVLRHA